MTAYPDNSPDLPINLANNTVATTPNVNDVDPHTDWHIRLHALMNQVRIDLGDLIGLGRGTDPYPFTQDGPITVDNSGPWPVIRDGLLRYARCSLSTPGTTTTHIEVWLNDSVKIAEFTIPANQTHYDVQLDAGGDIQVNVGDDLFLHYTTAGSGAIKLSTLLLVETLAGGMGPPGISIKGDDGQTGAQGQPGVGAQGWHEDPNTWTYQSATGIRVTGADVSAYYGQGVKIRWKQGGAYKYGVGKVVAGGANTDVTLMATTDFVVTNAAITNLAYSYESAPVGWPGEFNFAPTFRGVTVGAGTVTYAKWYMNGRLVKVRTRFVLGSGSAITGELGLDLPVTGDTAESAQVKGQGAMYRTSASAITFGAIIGAGDHVNLRPMVVSGVYLGYVVCSATVPFTWAATDFFTIECTYIAQ